MKKFGKVALVVVSVFLLIGLLVPVGYKIARNVWNWSLKQEKQALVCPECKECGTSTVVTEEKSSVKMDECLYTAGTLGLPEDVATYVCNGTEGKVSERLESGSKVPFGTITFDCQDTVWVLKDFTVPPFANYSFSYQNAERNLLNAPFLVGSELGWSSDCTQNNVPFKACYNTTDSGCELPSGADLFPTK